MIPKIRQVLMAGTLLLTSCLEKTALPPQNWEFEPETITWQTIVGERTTEELRIKNNSEQFIEIEISRPINDGNCPEDPFVAPPSLTRIGPNSTQVLRIDHAPETVPSTKSCLFRLKLTRRQQSFTDTRSVLLVGGVIDIDNDGDGTTRGEGDCNDRDPAIDPLSVYISPRRPEVCNGIDDDCDNLIDDDDNNDDLKWVGDACAEAPGDWFPTGVSCPPDPLVIGQLPWHPDSDGDTWPRQGTQPISRCEAPVGYVAPPVVGPDPQLPDDSDNNQGWDCNDQLFEVNPEAVELVGDGVDRNCDDNYTCYADADLDGWGDIDLSTLISWGKIHSDPYCQAAGVSAVLGDCDDANPTVNPGGIEQCTPGGDIDEDCDRLIDDADPSVSQDSQQVWFFDGDGDGYGQSAIFDLECTQPARYVDNAFDCNDANPAIKPLAPEHCDGTDEDCNGVPDDDAVDQKTWYLDLDGDSFGDEDSIAMGTIAVRCTLPPGFAVDDNDCVDNNAEIRPYRNEIPANTLDDNCDGLEDCYQNLDMDPFGTVILVPTTDLLCSISSGLARVYGDCDDSDPDSYPGAVEQCDTKDNDCDSLSDDDDPDLAAGTTYYRDADGDLFGDVASPRRGCQPPLGYVADNTDCDDANRLVYPGAAEITANNRDESCDGIENCWYDGDQDGFGDDARIIQASPVIACDDPGAFASPNDDDCDDTVATIKPTAAEQCDDFDVDENCNGLADDSDPNPVFRKVWFLDQDMDTYGSSLINTQACNQPPGYVAIAGDCNDGVASINPAGTEVCNGADDDCDGATDDSDASIIYTDPAGPGSTWYADLDGDGWGDPATTLVRCDSPVRFVASVGDCDDARPDIRPSAVETIADGIDQDCNGTEYCYVDADHDTWGTVLIQVDFTVDPTCSGTVPLGPAVTVRPGDCDDTLAGVRPDATEICDLIDDDCDGDIDDYDDSLFIDTRSDDRRFLRDGDADGYGNPGSVTFACGAPVGFVPYLAGGVPADTDCDDGDFLVNPGAVEERADAKDQDCDGLELCWLDADHDRFGVPLPGGTSATLRCRETGNADNTDDCDDSSAFISPAATEICDALDQDEDCDGLADDFDGSVTQGSQWFFDQDGDGQGNPALPLTACSAPPRFVATATDCNDNNPLIKVGGDEQCDPLNTDEDCDGLADDQDLDHLADFESEFWPDLDNDGYGEKGATSQWRCDPALNDVRNEDDCDDANPAVKPGATELTADGIDQDCNGTESCFCNRDGDDFGQSRPVQSSDFSCTPQPSLVMPPVDCDDPTVSVSFLSGDCDDEDPGIGLGQTPWFLDSDGDGFGNPSVVVVACQQPLGSWTTNSSDCSDSDATIHPYDPLLAGGVETCDAGNKDEDCDGAADNDDYVPAPPLGLRAVYADLDFDGYGDPTDVRMRCDPEFDESLIARDCDDDDPAIKPGAGEAPADGVDANCDGNERCYENLDDDAFGSDTLVYSTTLSCIGPGIAPQPGDCDDTNPAVGTSQTLWFLDNDDDGFGNQSIFVLACTAPGADWVTQGQDCNDGDGAVHPFDPAQPGEGIEICDAADVDEDCDGAADDRDVGVGGVVIPPTGPGALSVYVDFDRDGFGDGAEIRACDLAVGRSVADGDCDDLDPLVFPSAVESVADGIDQNCDDVEDCWDDDDNDDFGVSRKVQIDLMLFADCEDAPGAADNRDDCNDSDPAASLDLAVWFYDGDQDTYGDGTISLLTCVPPDPTLWVTRAGDCNDTLPGINPGAAEACNDRDDDCDGIIDDGASKTTWYRDADGDGAVLPEVTTEQCGALEPVGYSALGSVDCDDSRAAVNPAATETCNDLDDDCDGGIDEGVLPTWFRDQDDDGSIVAGVSVQRCTEPAGFSAAGPIDCDDTSATVEPGAAEVCDLVDNDCDGAIDEGVTFTYFRDADGDDFIIPEASLTTCAASPPVGFGTGTLPDCDDAVATVFPGAPETCNDRDDDCDGLIDDGAAKTTWYRDADSDGAVLSDVTVAQCGSAEPPGYSALGAFDCDDSRAAVNPGATEACNDLDDDCDGAIDESGATGGTTWWQDEDADGTRSDTVSAVACDRPDGYLADGAQVDCEDGDPLVFPGQVESCNGEDDDCDDKVDLYADCGADAWRYEHPTTERVYQFYDRPVSWFEADATCAVIGYHLVWFETGTEEDAVTEEAMGYLYYEDDRGGSSDPDWFGITVWAGYQDHGCSSAGWTRISDDTCTPVPGGAYDTTTGLPPSSSGPAVPYVIAIEREFQEPTTAPWLTFLGVEETYRFICEDYP